MLSSELIKMEQKPMNFGIIKDKIIKTDEVLNLLRKSQHETKDWKNKYKQIALTLKRSQLESDRFSTNIEVLTVKQKTLEEENKNLSEQYAFLEERYNKQMIESMKTIKDLQDELQMMQELKSETSTSKEPSSIVRNEDFKKEKEKLVAQLSELINEKNKLKEENDKTKELQSKNVENLKKIAELNSQITSILDNYNKDKQKIEVLEKQISVLNITNDKYKDVQHENKLLSHNLTNVKYELKQLKCMYTNKDFQNTYVQTDEQNFNKKITSNRENQTEITDSAEELAKSVLKYPKKMFETKNLEVSLQTDLQDPKQDLYFIENKKLIQKIEEYEKTITVLKDQVKPLKTNCCCPTEITDSVVYSDFEKENVYDILKEMSVLPRILSPFPSDENLVDHTDTPSQNIPNIIVTPSAPTDKRDNVLSENTIPLKKSPEVKDLIPGKLEINKINSSSKQNQIVAHEKEESTLLKVKKPKKKFYFSYNDFIRQQHSWQLLRQRKLKFKKKLNQIRNKSVLAKDGLLNSLKALKKSNINFVISNESTIPNYSQCYTNMYDVHKPKQNCRFVKTQPNASPHTIENLQCVLTNCKQNYMLMNKSSKGNELLGFFGIKPEAVTPTVSYNEPITENKLPEAGNNPKKDISADVIQQIANIVYEKLNNEIMNPKKTASKNSNSEYFEPFYSETETEIERLFKKTPTDILKQNKMLWEEAHYNSFGQTSTDDGNQSNTDDMFSEARSDTVSIFGEHSSIYSSENSAKCVPLNTDAINNHQINKTSHNSDSDTINSNFKVPMCPQILSPICSLSSIDIEKSPNYFSSPIMPRFPKLVSPMNPTPNPSLSAKKLIFSPIKNSAPVGEISVNSNVSYYLKKIIEDRQNLSYNLNRFIGTLPDELSNMDTKTSPAVSDQQEIFLKSASCIESHKIELFEKLKSQSFNDGENNNEDTSKKTHNNVPKGYCKTSPSFSRISQRTAEENSVDENVTPKLSDVIMLSCSELSPKVTKPEKHKSKNICQTECLRRSKRIIEQSFSDIINRKRRKSIPLVSSDSEEESMESQKSSMETFEERLKQEETAVERSLSCSEGSKNYITNKNLNSNKRKSLESSDRAPEPIDTPKSPVETIEHRLRLEDAEKTVDVNPSCKKVRTIFTTTKNVNSNIRKSPIKSDTLSDKHLGIRRKKKPVSKLQSRVLKQMKLKTRMMEARPTFDVADCDILDSNDKIVESYSKELSHIFIHKRNSMKEDSSKEVLPQQGNNLNKNESTLNNHCKLLSKVDRICAPSTCSKSDQDLSNNFTSKKENNKKINIVQNILIKPRFAIDLLKNVKKPKNSNPSSDILCGILHDMDKDRPKSRGDSIKEIPEDIPVSIDDKKFRNNVLDIAEVLHNGVKHKYQYQNMPSRDKSVLESKILQKGSNLPWNIKVLLGRLYDCLDKGYIRDDVINNFKQLHVDFITDVILHQVAKDFKDKPSIQYVNAPLLTERQKLFLCLMLRLEKEKYQEMTETFLTRTEQYLLYRGCNVKFCIPIVRLYLAICRLRGDITRVRKFLSDAFYLINDSAVPIFFAALTNWVDLMPKWDNWQSFPLSKVLFQVIHLKEESRPGYNLFPLKCLLAQYYGFPRERMNCDELFKELYNQYLNDPSVEREVAIRLLCKHKPKLWLYEKINKFFKPLVYKIPMENINFKATVIILTGKLCQYFRPKHLVEEGYLTELRRWFLGLIEDGAPQLITDSVHYVMEKLPKKRYNKKAKQKE